MQNKKKPVPEISTATLEITDLIAHPMQERYFFQCTAAEEDSLRKSLHQKGQRDPIAVIAVVVNGMQRWKIMDGHRRVKLLQELGKKTVRAVIRGDLANATESEVNAEFLSYNAERRHLTTLAKIRVIVGPQGVPTETKFRTELVKRITAATSLSPANIRAISTRC